MLQVLLSPPSGHQRVEGDGGVQRVREQDGRRQAGGAGGQVQGDQGPGHADHQRAGGGEHIQLSPCVVCGNYGRGLQVK